MSANYLTNPPNFWRFHENLYQIHFSGCSALYESRCQSVLHPYRPLRAPAFFRISRNQVQANNPQVSSISWLLFNRPVDWSRSISTVDKYWPTCEYCRYWRSISIHLLENTVNIWSTINFTPKLDKINRQYGFIPKQNWSISTIDVSAYQKKIIWRSISTAEVDMDSKKIVNIDLTHPYFITNRYKWRTRTLTSFHGDQFQALITKQLTRKKQTYADKV